VVSRIRDELGGELPLRAIFEVPATLESIAARVDALARDSVPAEEAPRPVSGRRNGPYLPLSPSQAGLWALERLNPSAGAYNVAFALRMRGELDVHALERALGEIVHRH